LAWLPQQDPSAVASADVPQHGPAVGSVSVSTGVGALLQQPSLAVGDEAADGSLARPARSESLMVFSSEWI
jgi:hypothetical protein